MAMASCASAAIDPHHILTTLREKMQGAVPALEAWLDATESERREAARLCFERRELDALAALRLEESVAQLLLRRKEQAFMAAHEAWLLVAGRSSGSVQAIVLTQLAASSHQRGDLRGAIRAMRRAEALVVADGGDDTPQVLAVRAQLIALLREKGIDATHVATRRDQTLAALLRSAESAQAVERFQRLVDVFVGRPDPPCWALSYCLRWRNVHGPGSPVPVSDR